MMGSSRVAGVEFYRMGQTNVLGRYPVHFHWNEYGSQNYATDNAIHHCFFRAVVVHNTQSVLVSRNVAFDIDGHTYYLESGVEEDNTIEFNLAAHVHCIGFYISNPNNIIIGNAASGGWSGYQFPILPEPVDSDLRDMYKDDMITPNKKDTNIFEGNSAHSTGGGMAGWLFRSDWTEFDGLEVHDFMDQPAFLLMEVWYNNFAVNCRSSNQPHIPNPSDTHGQDRRYSEPELHLNVFRAYDHLVKHIVTNWEISNCGGDNGNIWTQHAAAFAPEINTVSSGIVYKDENPLALRDQPGFFGSVFGCCSFGQFFRVWSDMDGSLSMRGKPTFLGAAVAPEWWKVGDRPGECEDFTHWEFAMWGCDIRGRDLSYTTLYNPYRPQDPDVRVDRLIFTGTVTHFGRPGAILEGDLLADDFIAEGSSPIGGQLDVVGVHDHSIYGGWYYWSVFGTPIKIVFDKQEMTVGSTLIIATSLPPGTPSSQIHIYAQIYPGNRFEAIHDYTQVDTLAQVRTDPGYDKWYHDTATDTLYWRVIDLYVTDDGVVWKEEYNPNYGAKFERGGVSLEQDYGTFASINVEIDCASSDGAYCDEMPVFRVPDMGCPKGHAPASIDTCWCVNSSICTCEDGFTGAACDQPIAANDNSDCTTECSDEFINCHRAKTNQNLDDPYSICRNELDNGIGPIGTKCEAGCTNTAEMEALNTGSDVTEDVTTNTEDDNPTQEDPVTVDDKPTEPTVCTAENQGRCECAQLEGLIAGVTTYTWWDTYGEQRCFTLYIGENTPKPAPIVIVPQCYSNDRLSNGIFGRTETDFTKAADRYEFVAVYVSTSNPDSNNWRWGADGVMSETYNPCAREDGEDINYMHDIMDFFAADPATFDALDIYFTGFSQNSMASQYFGYCFRDRVKGAWNAGSSLIDIPSDITTPALEGQCTRSSYEEHGRDCMTIDPCQDCAFFSINPYVGPNTRRWITCIMSYTDDNIAIPTVEPGKTHWNAAGHDARVLLFDGGRAHQNAYNHYDWTVSCLGVRDPCTSECENSFTQCVQSQSGDSWDNFEACNEQKESLVGCTKSCAPTFNMMALSEEPAAELMAGNWGTQTTPFEGGDDSGNTGGTDSGTDDNANEDEDVEDETPGTPTDTDSECSSGCESAFTMCVSFQSTNLGDGAYAQCETLLSNQIGNVGNNCEAGCTYTDAMAALEPAGTDTGDDQSGTDDSGTDDSGTNEDDVPVVDDDNTTPTTPTYCTEANKGRCQCAQLEGLLDGVVTYTWWDSFGEQRCFSLYVPQDIQLPAPILFVPHCYSQDRLTSGFFGPRETDLTEAAARYEFIPVYISTSNPDSNDWRWGNDGIMSTTNNPCDREDGEDISYVHDVMDFLAADTAKYDSENIYFSGFSQNSMASQYFGYCFRDRVKGAWNAGSSLINLPSDITTPALEGQCTRSSYAEHGRDCMTIDPCEECAFFSINPYVGAATRRWVTCIMSYTDDNIAIPTVDVGKEHWHASGHDARVLLFDGGRGHRDAHNNYDWTVSCLGMTEPCSTDCESSFAACVEQQTSTSNENFAECIAVKETLTGCTKRCAPTLEMMKLSESVNVELMSGNWGAETSPWEGETPDVPEVPVDDEDQADDDSTNEPVASCPTACAAALADPANKASICSGDTSPYPCSLMDAQTHALNCLAEITTALTACIPTGDCPTDCAAAIAEPANKDSICSGDKENLVLPSPCTQMDGMVCSSEVYAACMGGGGGGCTGLESTVCEMYDSCVFDYTAQTCGDCPGKCQTGPTDYECCGDDDMICIETPHSDGISVQVSCGSEQICAGLPSTSCEMNEYCAFDYSTQTCNDCPGKCQTGTEYECCGTTTGSVCLTVVDSMGMSNQECSTPEDSTECKNAEALASNCDMVASNLGCDRLVNTIPNQKVTDYCARESCDGLTVKDVCPIPCNNCPGDAAGGGECPTDCAAALAEPANKESLCGENEDPPPSPCTEMDGPKCMSEIMAVCSGSTEESSCPTECATAITDNKASICSGDKDNFALPSPCTQMDIMSCYGELMTACMGIGECPTECAAAVAEPANEETLCGDSDTGDNPFPSPCTLMDGIFCSSEMMAVCGMPQGDCDDTTCGDKCEDMPTTCAELKDMVTKANGCASSCSQCMVDLFNERLECTGNNRVVVEQPAADKKVVKFEVTLSISKADYETHKDQIKKDFATILDTTTDKITITVVSRRARRLLTESVKLEVAVKAADADAASAIETKVKGDSFETDLAKEITDNTAGLNVEVTGVSEPKSENLTTTTDDDDSNNTTMIIIIVVAVVVVLLIAAFVCYTMNNNDKMQKEVGGEAVEMNSDKRTPGLNA